MRTKDFLDGDVATPTIEDMIRETLISVAKSELGWDVAQHSASNPNSPILKVFDERMGNEYSRAKLTKAFMNWARPKIDAFSRLTADEQKRLKRLYEEINASFAT
jgi:hypothetical protein